jgi:hypothetical protein
MEEVSRQSVACNSRTVQTESRSDDSQWQQNDGQGLKISYPWLIYPSNTMALHDKVGSMGEMPQLRLSSNIAWRMGNGNHLLIQECTPAIGNFDYCFAPSYLIGRGLRFVFRNIG